VDCLSYFACVLLVSLCKHDELTEIVSGGGGMLPQVAVLGGVKISLTVT